MTNWMEKMALALAAMGTVSRIGPLIAAGAKREQQCVTLFPANNRLVCFQVPKPIDSLYFPCKK